MLFYQFTYINSHDNILVELKQQSKTLASRQVRLSFLPRPRVHRFSFSPRANNGFIAVIVLTRYFVDKVNAHNKLAMTLTSHESIASKIFARLARHKCFR